jgi:hypothetical protein
LRELYLSALWHLTLLCCIDLNVLCCFPFDLEQVKMVLNIHTLLNFNPLHN